jgi:glycine cleavage system H protein
VTGQITAVNETLSDSPERINDSPYEDGWVIEVEAEDPKELDILMKSGAYLAFVKTLAPIEE